MPYRTNDDLPPALRKHLPEQAQDIYRVAFNQAYAAFAGDGLRERRSDMMGWAAVKRIYNQDGETWVQRGAAIS